MRPAPRIDISSPMYWPPHLYGADGARQASVPQADGEDGRENEIGEDDAVLTRLREADGEPDGITRCLGCGTETNALSKGVCIACRR
jgi:hypothetical protein